MKLRSCAWMRCDFSECSNSMGRPPARLPPSSPLGCRLSTPPAPLPRKVCHSDERGVDSPRTPCPATRIAPDCPLPNDRNVGYHLDTTVISLRPKAFADKLIEGFISGGTAR